MDDKLTIVDALQLLSERLEEHFGALTNIHMSIDETTEQLKRIAAALEAHNTILSQ